jgi:hypothetical protein
MRFSKIRTVEIYTQTSSRAAATRDTHTPAASRRRFKEEEKDELYRFLKAR